MKQFNVMLWDFNLDTIVPYDVMPYFLNCYKERKKKKSQPTPETLDDFRKLVESESRYRFWSRCEYEMICNGWPNGKKELKIDVHQQVMMNIDLIAELLYDEVKKKKIKDINKN